MKSLHDLLIHRRSIRKYTQEALSPEAVKTILEAGLLAPSSVGVHCGGRQRNARPFVRM